MAKLQPFVEPFGASNCYHSPPPPATQKKKGGGKASSTTEEEMSDLLWHTTHIFHKKTWDWPYLCFDNNKIQKSIDVTNIPYPENCAVPGEALHLPADRKIPLPTHSPDCNWPAEHSFGHGKSRIRNHLYSSGKRITSAHDLRVAVRKQFTKFMPDGAVAADVERLWLLYEMISTPAGVTYEGEDGKMHVGTGGNWGPKGFM